MTVKISSKLPAEFEKNGLDSNLQHRVEHASFGGIAVIALLEPSKRLENLGKKDDSVDYTLNIVEIEPIPSGEYLRTVDRLAQLREQRTGKKRLPFDDKEIAPKKALPAARVVKEPKPKKVSKKTKQTIFDANAAANKAVKETAKPKAKKASK